MASIELWTIQLAQWRKAKALGIELIDITVRSGTPVFAPSWEMVRKVKGANDGNKEAEAIYTKEYLELMRKSWRTNRSEWLSLLSKPKVAIACFCSDGTFCHRYLLVEYLRLAAVKLDIEFTYMGELK